MRSLFLTFFCSLLLPVLAQADPIPLNFDPSLNAGNGGTNTASGQIPAGETLTFAITIPAELTLPNGSLAEGLRIDISALTVLYYTDPAHPEEGAETYGDVMDFLAPIFSAGRTFYVQIGDAESTVLQSYEITASAVTVTDVGVLPAAADQVFYDSAAGLPEPEWQFVSDDKYYKLTIPPGNPGIFLAEIRWSDGIGSDYYLVGRAESPPGFGDIQDTQMKRFEEQWATVGHGTTTVDCAIVPIGREAVELKPGTYYLRLKKGAGGVGKVRLRLKTAPTSQPLPLNGTTVAAQIPAGTWQWFHFVMPDPPPPGLNFVGTDGLKWLLRDTVRPSWVGWNLFFEDQSLGVYADRKNFWSNFIHYAESQHLDTRRGLRPGATYYFGVLNETSSLQTAEISLAPDSGTIVVPVVDFLNGSWSGTLDPGQSQEVRINAPADAQRLNLAFQGASGVTATVEQGSPARADVALAHWKLDLQNTLPFHLEKDLGTNQPWPWRAGNSYWVKLTNQGLEPVAVSIQSAGKSPANSDDDQDGMLDGWELTHFGTMERDGAGDYDFEGVSDLQEFLDGTNPEDFLSYRCRVVLTVVGDGAVTLSPQAPSYPQGTSLEVTAVPNPGATLIKWLSTNEDGNMELEVNLNGVGLGLIRPYTHLKAVFSNGALGQAVDQPTWLWWTGEGYSSFGGNAQPWISQSTMTHDGVDAARSGAPPLGRGTGISTRLMEGGKLNFQWKVGQPGSFSAYGRILIDGMQVKSRFGFQDWTADFIDVPAGGTHVVTWEAFGAGFPAPGAQPDFVWLDEVSFMPLPADDDHDGLADIWELQWFDELGYQGWMDPDGDGNDNATEFADGTIPMNASSLRPRLWITALGGGYTVDPMQESYSYGQAVTVTAQGADFSHFEGDLTTSTNPLPLTLTRTLRLQAIFDPGLDVALDEYSGWTSVLSPGGHGWKGRVDFTGPTDGDVAATQPGQPLDTQSNLSRTFTGPLVLSFWWKVEQGQTFLPHEKATLFVSMDGQKQTTCTSGNGWSMESLYIPAGDHDVVFSFKTSPTGTGKERAWLDQVRPLLLMGGGLALQNMLLAGGTPPDKALPFADADGDGASNLMEWALGSDPANVGSQSSLPPPHMDGNNLCVTIPLPPGRDLTGIHFDFQTSSDLQTWTSHGASVQQNGNTLEACAEAGINVNGLFMRLLVSITN